MFTLLVSYNKLFYQSFVILITLLFLSACAQPRVARVEDRSQPPSRKISQHVVAKGDTLFAISWRYGLDLDRFARANGLTRKSTLYPGQILVLKEKARPQSTAKTALQAPVKKPPASRTSPSLRQKTVKRSEKQAVKNPSVSAKPATASKIVWRWPAKGKVVTNFGGSKRVNQGIDIRGKKGDSVTAAASGRVVFAGSGLRGYGKLIIIKHNTVFLSAYAHNHRLHVKEGDKVKVGQLIADLGSTDSDVDKLHFEIRLDGKPVNPLRYLPKK